MAALSTLLVCLLVLCSPAAAQDEGLSAAPVEAWLESVMVLVTGSAWCSAVLIDDQGTVATAYHCVASGRRPQLTTRDGRTSVGRVVATAPRQDLALIVAPELAGLAYLEVREAGAVQGETVWALGHPFAPQADTSPLLAGTLKWSASRGVVSAVGERLVQVDAALNPGNSGGPIVDQQGRVIGIASRRLSGDNIAFISPASGITGLENERRKPVIGGTWGASVVALQGLEFDGAPSLGAAMELGLRDRVLFRAGLLFPVGQRWTALSLGSSSWAAGELAASLRLRVGRGRWSTTLDMGGTCLVMEGVRAELAEDTIQMWAAPTTLHPGGAFALGMGGSGLRLLLVHGESGWTTMLGVDLGFPGVMGIF